MAESETDELQDTEITLGTGKLLVIFFGLVFLCSVFFTIGYLFGRGNAAGTAKIDIVGGEAGGSTAGKPSAVNKNSQAGPTANTATSQPTQAPASVSSVPGAPAANTAPATLVPASSAGSADAQSGASAGAIYMVQVAAVSKREDADVLVIALQKKQYPVFVANAPGDTLFHVQVGPFTDPKDAETMRSRLAAEGYNPIVKR